MSNLSQTQIANYTTMAGVIVMILAKAGVETTTDVVLFAIAATASIGSTAYNWYNRYKKGDLTIAGVRK